MNTKQLISTALLCTVLGSRPAIANTALSFDSLTFHLVQRAAMNVPVRLPNYMPTRLYPVDWSDMDNHQFNLMLGSVPHCDATSCNMGHIFTQRKPVSHQVSEENFLAHETFKLSNGITASYWYENEHSAGNRRSIYWRQNKWQYGIELRDIVATKTQIIRVAESMSEQTPIKGIPADEE